MEPKVFDFYINFSGERAAGLHPFSENVKIEIESGDLGGEQEEQAFVEAFTDFLEGWYDGAAVMRMNR